MRSVARTRGLVSSEDSEFGDPSVHSVVGWGVTVTACRRAVREFAPAPDEPCGRECLRMSRELLTEPAGVQPLALHPSHVHGAIERDDARLGESLSLVVGESMGVRFSFSARFCEIYPCQLVPGSCRRDPIFDVFDVVRVVPNLVRECSVQLRGSGGVSGLRDLERTLRFDDFMAILTKTGELFLIGQRE